MAQTGYTPILIYSSSTASQAPAAGNLTNSTLGSELAINITDGKLFYKDNANNVQVIAWKTTPTTAGGTGLTSYTAGDLLYYATGTTLTKLAIGTAYQHLGVNAGGTAPEWQPSANSVLTSQGDLLYASAANTLARLAKNTTATRYLSNTGTSNDPAWAQIDLTNGVTGILPVANGGTNASSASITAFNNITGYTASGATGTTSTNLVFSTSPSLTTPRIITSINDTNGNELIGVTATASAVNEMTVANAATGSNPALSATGNDTNIGVVINTKGTGKVGINKAVPVALLDINGAEALANGNPGGGSNAGLLSFSTWNDGGGNNISRNSFISPPFIGILFAYEIGTDKSFTGIMYKQDATTTNPVITQIHSTGSLVVSATNAAGTIALGGFTTSANVRMMLLQVNSIAA
jgi:hypothetical protein